MSPLQSEQPWLVCATQITEHLCALPAVATPDWCDRAAVCFLPLVERGVVGIMVGTLTGQGTIEDREAVGAAVIGPADQGDSQIPNMVRSRADRLPALGFAVSAEALDRGFCGTAERFSLPRDWRTGPLGRMWSDAATGDLLLGAVPLGREVPGRMIVVMIARQDASPAGTAREGVLGAVLPVLARRGVLAIGTGRTSSGDWLTLREQLVLERLTLGMSVADIAAEIGRSSHTVHDHVKSLHRKLHASSRGELIARALGHLAEVKPRTAAKRRAAPAGAARGESRVEEIKPEARRVRTP